MDCHKTGSFAIVHYYLIMCYIVFYVQNPKRISINRQQPNTCLDYQVFLP